MQLAVNDALWFCRTLVAHFVGVNFKVLDKKILLMGERTHWSSFEIYMCMRGHGYARSRFNGSPKLVDRSSDRALIHPVRLGLEDHSKFGIRSIRLVLGLQ